MSRPATTRLKVNPPLGQLPVLQYCAPDQLKIDDQYQRSLDARPSQTLIRRIAVHWDWSLCQPLIVARRTDGGLYVVDGQHRLAAARLRGDIWQLPCVVASYRDAAEEAASFVALNQQRRPLSKLSVFKAAVAAGDEEAIAITRALDEAGLKLSSSSNLSAAPPGALINLGGLTNCLRNHGEQVLVAALDVLAQAWKDERLLYAGTIFPGLSSIVAIEVKRVIPHEAWRDSDGFLLMVEMLAGASQEEWYSDICAAVVAAGPDGQLARRRAAAGVLATAWAECVEAMLDEAA